MIPFVPPFNLVRMNFAHAQVQGHVKIPLWLVIITPLSVFNISMTQESFTVQASRTWVDRRRPSNARARHRRTRQLTSLRRGKHRIVAAKT